MSSTRKSSLIARAYAALIDQQVVKRGTGLVNLWRTPDAPEAEEMARVVVSTLWEAGVFETDSPGGQRAALIPSIERAMFGTEDGGMVDDQADLPVGELRRLLREVWVPAETEPPRHHEGDGAGGTQGLRASGEAEGSTAAAECRRILAAFDPNADDSEGLTHMGVDAYVIDDALNLAAAELVSMSGELEAIRAVLDEKFDGGVPASLSLVDAMKEALDGEYHRGLKFGYADAARLAASQQRALSDALLDSATPPCGQLGCTNLRSHRHEPINVTDGDAQ